MRLLLIRHAGTAGTRRPVVPDDGPAGGPLPGLTGWLGRSGTTMTSPARRCAQPGAPVDPRVGPWDLGIWTGPAVRRARLGGWRTDPAAGLLDDWHGRSGRLAAVTHAAVIKAMVVHALRAPIEAVRVSTSFRRPSRSCTRPRPAGA